MIQIQDELIKQGHKVIHVHVNFTKEKFPSFDSKSGFETYHININPKNPFFEIVTYAKILNLFKRLHQKIDVIYTRGSYYIIPLSFIKKSYNIPVFCTLTSDEMSYNLLKRLKTGTFKKSHLISGFLRDFFYSSIEIISQNSNQQISLKDQFNIESRMIISGHPIPENHKKESKLPIIVWINNIRPFKRLEIFLNLVSKFKNDKVIFICAGQIKNNKDRILLKFVEKNQRNFKYIGKIDFDTSNKLLERSNFLVNTSTKYGEGFSNTFIQAWLRGVPVISLGSNPNNLISDNQLGYVSKDEDELYSYTRKLIRDKNLCNKIGQASNNFAKKHLSINNTVKKLTHYFREIKNGNTEEVVLEQN